MCGLAIFHGLDILRFQLAEYAHDEESDRSRVLRPWIDVAGIGEYARAASLSTVADARDSHAAERRRDALTRMLSLAPLVSAHWLSLSGMRLVAGQRPDEVAAAMGLSTLTGPNEGTVMAERAMFALSLWDSLPAETRQNARSAPAASW